MTEKKLKRILRPATAEERKRHAEIRQKVAQEYPPTDDAAGRESPPGIPTQIRQARQARSLTWHAVAELAGIGDSRTVRDIELGKDAQISDLQAVAKALGLRLELVEEKVPA
jgi:hypothetical protein